MSDALNDIDDLVGGLDVLLVDAALSRARRFGPGRSGLTMAGHLARRPRIVARRGRELATELVRVATGASAAASAPAAKDRRFADPAWRDNAVLRRVLQTYLATARTTESLLADADLDWRDAERMRFVLGNLIDALAPSNNPLLNPQAWKAAIDTGGRNIPRGMARFAQDMRSAPRLPAMVEADAFEVGGDLALTPGAVVYRSEVLELIQYRPQTATVRERPLLLVPPTINKFYVLDLAPGRSMVEYFVQQGQQVFVISWRNPDARHAGWDLDTYGQAIIDSLDVVSSITGSAQAVLTGICSGGILAALVMGHLAAIGQQDRLAGLGLAVTMLDQDRAGVGGALLDETTANAAIAASRARGYLDGRSLAEVFAWLRPNDLIWNYWVNDYLLGKSPEPFDILFWNADTTRMTAGLHRDFIELARTNAITAGRAEILGTEIDLGKVTTDAYVVAAVADHICPWPVCYGSTQLLGGSSRFVLSTNGHIAAMVNPPGNPKASFLVAEQTPPTTEQWQAAAERHDGSWWTDFDSWLAPRSGEEHPAPDELGSLTHPPVDPAPGSYVYDN